MRDAVMNVGLLYDERFLEHRAPAGHPECEQRLEACVQALEQAELWSRFERVDARRASAEQLGLCHEEPYIRRVLGAEGLVGQLDHDTFMSPGSVEAALLAAG
ncbi:MAG: histone deacetylase, partial [Myxococcales bacterium]|nr:histone deacetylase [Myxococcales bacterium]